MGSSHIGASNVPITPWNFLSLMDYQSDPTSSKAVVIPVPYDGTASYRTGAREGPWAVIQASRELEDYDPELDWEPSQLGIYTAPPLEPHMAGPEHMLKRVRQAVKTLAHGKEVVALLGGDHSISLGAVQALREFYPDLSVLYLDAHADMREEYMGTRFGHASVAKRIVEEECPLVQVGVRTLSLEERDFIGRLGVPVFLDQGLKGKLPNAEEVLPFLSPNVYISVDLDVLDPSIMPDVGNPEPGGPSWYDVITLLKEVSKHCRIVGFDVVELCPPQGSSPSPLIAAKLVYKILGYALAAARK
jgi:agmatinase